MPNDPAVWIVLIIVLGVVVALALWLGRGFSVKKNKEGIAIKVDSAEKAGNAADQTTISVAREAEIKEKAQVGNIVGVQISGQSASGKDKEKIDVFSGGTVKDSTVGDIVGKKSEE